MKYEMKQIEIDPFDIMCGECQEHYIEWWKPVTEAELKEEHEYQVAADNSIPEFQKEIMIQEDQWFETETDFDKWLEQSIAEGYVRKVEEDKKMTFQEWLDNTFYKDFDASGLSDEEYFELEDQYNHEVKEV